MPSGAAAGGRGGRDLGGEIARVAAGEDLALDRLHLRFERPDAPVERRRIGRGQRRGGSKEKQRDGNLQRTSLKSE